MYKPLPSPPQKGRELVSAQYYSLSSLNFFNKKITSHEKSLDRVVEALILRMNVSLEITHNLLKVALCSTATIFLSSVPRTYSMFYIVLWIVVRLNEQKHLF